MTNTQRAAVRLAFAIWVALAPTAGRSEPQAPPAAAIAQLLADPAMPAGLVAGGPLRHVGPWLQVPVLSAKAGADRRGGWINYDPAASAFVSFHAPVPALVPAVKASAAAAEEVALRFAERRWTARLGATDHLEAASRGINGLGSGCWDFAVTAYRGHVSLPLAATIGVRAWDLRVGSVFITEEADVIVPFEAAIGEQQACDVARTEVVGMGGSAVEVVRAAECIGKPGLARQYHYFLVTILARMDFHGERLVCSVGLYVDATTGKPLNFGVTPLPLGFQVPAGQPLRLPEGLPSGPTDLISDRFPTWLQSPDGRLLVAFASNRSRYGHPRYLDHDQRTVFAVDPETGQVVCLSQAVSVGTDGPLASGGTRLAVVSQRADIVRVLDLRDGGCFEATGAAVPGYRPALSPSGRRLAVLADRNRGRLELYVGELTASEFRSPRRPIELAQSQGAAMFAGSDDELFFLAERQAMPGGRRPSAWDLLRTTVPAAGVSTTPALVAADVGQVLGSSVTQDGAKVLLWTDGGAKLIEARTGLARSLPLSRLHDPDQPDAPDLEAALPVISPDGQRVVFSASPWRRVGQEPSGEYLYVCNLDGSGVKRITPLEDVVAPPFIFPFTGKPAFEVPPEYAKPYVMP